MKILARNPLLALARLVPFEVRCAARKRLEDFGPALCFRLSRRRRAEALSDCRACSTLEEYFRFSQKWLGVGSIQIPQEIGAALSYLAAEKPGIVCEIGTEFGGTTFLLSHYLPDVETMISIDLFVRHAAVLRAVKPARQDVHYVHGSSYSPRIVRRVERLLKGRKLDVLFIDGDHRYEGVKRDFLSYRHLVRDGGSILFHDIVLDHGARFGRTALGAWSGGVPQFWQEVSAFYQHHEFINDPNQDGLGIGVLRYDGAVEFGVAP